MNTEQMHGHLRTMKGWAIESWGRMTNDPWRRIAGRREQLLGRMQASLAESRRKAEFNFPVRQAAGQSRPRGSR
ncbi:MAG: CsbD family protein [Usitatibacter sp.]